jgi:NADH dehydrogenase (ubiquinone) 1 beta subcomplex subunit 8
MNRMLLFQAPKLLFSSARAISTTAARSGHFAKDFKPGPYPNTEQERIAAAKKYGMLPEDYKPMTDDGLGFGDYPDIPEISPDMKDDWEYYEDEFNKRHFGEPVRNFWLLNYW